MFGSLVAVRLGLLETDKSESWLRCPTCRQKLFRNLAVGDEEIEDIRYCRYCGADIRNYIKERKEWIAKIRKKNPNVFMNAKK